MVGLEGGEGQRRADVVRLQVGEVGQDLGLGDAGGEQVQDVLDAVRRPRRQGRPPRWFGFTVIRSSSDMAGDLTAG